MKHPWVSPHGALFSGRRRARLVRVILHADADAFFASVEQRDDPALRGRPMVVAHEVVACPSYEARALGIHAGMPLARSAALAAGARDRLPPRGLRGGVRRALRGLPPLHPARRAGLGRGGLPRRRRVATGATRAGLAAALRSACRAEVGPARSRSGSGAPSSWPSSRAGAPSPTASSSSTPSSRRACVRGCASTSSGASGRRPGGSSTRRAVRRRRPARLVDEDDLKRLVSTAMARRLVSIATAPTTRRSGCRDLAARSARAGRCPPTRTRSKVVAVLDECVGRACTGSSPSTGPARLPRRLEVLVRYDDGTQVPAAWPAAAPSVDPGRRCGPRPGTCSSRRHTSGTGAA